MVPNLSEVADEQFLSVWSSDLVDLNPDLPQTSNVLASVPLNTASSSKPAPVPSSASSSSSELPSKNRAAVVSSWRKPAPLPPALDALNCRPRLERNTFYQSVYHYFFHTPE